MGGGDEGRGGAKNATEGGGAVKLSTKTDKK
jgi:hypothetical protein